ncbi:MAG: HAD-IIA family hydrolase [Sulfurospirillum sp.]|nr:HAD-IIA family hydrolase [Sulfurospirillum sp.]MBL0702480.1 HAD-IIA family hydrolase [Sulfurospirillum sp.]
MYLIDVQGTLIDDINKLPISGAIEFIESLNSQLIPYAIVTNNSKKPSEEFYNYLKKLGFNIPKSSYLDPLMVLKHSLHVKKVCCFGTSEFVKVIESLGYENTFTNPEAILLTSSKEFNSDIFSNMIEMVLSGAKLIGMHGTSIYSKNGRRYAGVGAILKMISHATNSSYEVIGKPSPIFYREALKILHVTNFKNIEMISDDAVGDLVGIKELGAKTTLVLSGKCKNKEEIVHVKNKIDRVANSIKELVDNSHQKLS